MVVSVREAGTGTGGHDVTDTSHFSRSINSGTMRRAPRALSVSPCGLYHICVRSHAPDGR